MSIYRLDKDLSQLSQPPRSAKLSVNPSSHQQLHQSFNRRPTIIHSTPFIMSAVSSSESLNTQILHIKGSVECSHPACHLHDFLPIKCPGCSLLYCTPHHSPFNSATSGHPCSSPPPDRTPIPCPLCQLPISTNPGGDPNIRMDAHMGSRECSEKILEKGRAEKEIIRGRKEKGELCFNKGCKKTVQGGLGVKCETCKRSYCHPHRFPSSHSCSTVAPQATQKPISNTRSILGGPSREAALAAIKRANLSGKSNLKPFPAPKPIATRKPEPKPLSPKEKDVNPNDQKTRIKPIMNPLSATSRHTKAESSSRRQALANRARLGILNEEEKLMWAEMVGQEERERRRAGGKSKEKGCVMC